MTAREVGERVDSPEMTDWVAYDKVHVSRTDALLATLCALTYNANKRADAPTRGAEFFLGIKKQSDPGDVQRQLMGWARMRGSKGAG